MATINERILDGQVLHAMALQKYTAGGLKRMIGLLNEAEADLEAQLQTRLSKITERGFDLGPESTKRLSAMLEQIEKTRAKLYREFQRRLADDLFSLVENEIDFQIRLLDDSVGVTLETAVPSAASLNAIVKSQPLQGALLKDWAEGLGRDEYQRLSKAIKLGLSEGQTTDQIVRRIVGTRKQQYADGLLEISRREASAVLRTAITHVTNRAREEFWADNADIIQGVQWVSTLDGRTSATCRARDGKIYPIKSGPRPPAHFNCRSITVAYLGPDTVRGNRASAIGPVPAHLNYEDWLRKQPAAFQDQVLGTKKAKLFRDGKMSLDRFVDRQGEELTLDELRQRDKEIFERVLG